MKKFHIFPTPTPGFFCMCLEFGEASSFSTILSRDELVALNLAAVEAQEEAEVRWEEKPKKRKGRSKR